VVTPEAVVLDVQTAGLGSRVFAKAIDFLVQGASLVIFLTVIFTSRIDNLAVVLVVTTVIVLLYPIILEALWRGRTVGKAALGLRVVTREGAPIRFRHAAIRGMFGLLEVLALPMVGVLAMLGSRTDQRLGDMVAGTIVIRERAAAKASWPAVFYPPPGLESYVATLDVSAMTAGEYETVRSFLLRAYEMDPLPRANLAARLAGPLVLRWHQPVPDGVGPEIWLVCAASAYQQRSGMLPGGPLPYGAPGPYGAGAPDPWLANGGWGPPPPGTRMDGPGAPSGNGYPPPAPFGPSGYPPPPAPVGPSGYPAPVGPSGYPPPPAPVGSSGYPPPPPVQYPPGPAGPPSGPPGQAPPPPLPAGIANAPTSSIPSSVSPSDPSQPGDGGFVPPA
jgi:uncharacterized RDD family membrane protein YckC